MRNSASYRGGSVFKVLGDNGQTPSWGFTLSHLWMTLVRSMRDPECVAELGTHASEHRLSIPEEDTKRMGASRTSWKQ